MKRRRSTLAAVALTVGVLVVGLVGKGGQYFMMPNKLSTPHAGLTDCSTCHAGAQAGRVDLLHRLFTAVEPRQNSNLCITCHVMGPDPFTPHTHPVEKLELITKNLRKESVNWPVPKIMQRIAFPSIAGAPKAEEEILCATCHQEHKGVFADLKSVSNQRCQTCHVARFGSFADSHPQFTKFPYHRRPRIAFDHQSHMGKHFPEAVKAAVPGQAAPVDCSDCHQMGVRNRYMMVKSFANMCSGCHAADITGMTVVSGPKGIGVIAVPGLDVKTLRERGFDIGGWPDSEASLTPFMKLLLGSNDENVIASVSKLDLLDLSKATDRDLANVTSLAWAVKRLFNQLETTNPAAASTSAGDKSRTGFNVLQMAALTGNMSHDVITSANREWFPDLQDDLQRHARGEATSNFKPPAKPALLAVNPQATQSDNKATPPRKSGASSPGDTLAPSPVAKDKGNDILATQNQDDILGPNKKDEIPLPGKQGAGPQPKSDDILAPSASQDDILSSDKSSPGNALSAVGDDSSPTPKPETGDSPKQAATSSDAKNAPAAPARFDPEAWAQSGGWYREDFTIRYRPSGHADQFLQTWLDLSGRAYGTSAGKDLGLIFDELSAKDAIGRCTKCHSVDQLTGAKIVNWQPFDPNSIRNRFTKFAHKPHVELVGSKTCIRCHELRQTDDYSKSYEGGDPVEYVPNFKYVDKALCATCHSQQTEWQNCTLCHGYHVQEITPAASTPTQVGFEKSALSAAFPALDPEAETAQEFARAREAGTEQALDDFIASHPSGPYHDQALKRAVELSQAASVKASAALPQDARLAQPANSGSSDKLSTSENETSAPEHTTAPIGKLATAIPPDATPAAPAKAVDSSDAVAPRDIDGFNRRGEQRALRGELQLAVLDFNEAIQRDASNVVALNNRCWVRALLDETQTALEDCNAALKAVPNYAEAFDSRGLVNLKLGFYKKSIADYSAALAQFRGARRASALFGRGIAKRRTGNAAGAKADIDLARLYNSKIAAEFANFGIQ